MRCGVVWGVIAVVIKKKSWVRPICSCVSGDIGEKTAGALSMGHGW